jgi:2-dehydro-3-deoxyglucarate aldolase/4-hydroxy-2-oxoheptanedioate aldolase
MPSIRETLTDNGRVFGTMIFEFYVPGIAQLSQVAGADFLVYDMEHAGAGIDTIKQQMAYARGLAITPIVRVPNSEYHFIARTLDCGAKGIMVPMVETPEQAAAIVQAAKYPPTGRRGAAFGIAHDDYSGGAVADKIAAANRDILLIAQIESAAGAKNLEAIAATPGIDVLWLGHFDLTNSLGIPGQFQHPEYLRIARDIAVTARRHDKVAGIMAANEAWAREYAGYGYTMIAYGLDHHIFQQGLASGLSMLKSL